jgi:DNA-binding Lrp family transcriptional regulator
LNNLHTDSALDEPEVTTLASKNTADAIDARLLRALTVDPRAATIALAERTGVSRNTVQARLSRWGQTDALTSFERTISPDFLGYPLRAFMLTNVKQRRLGEVSVALADVPEVIEVYGLSLAVLPISSSRLSHATPTTCIASQDRFSASAGSSAPIPRW